jgi:hypothetical protein
MFTDSRVSFELPVVIFARLSLHDLDAWVRPVRVYLLASATADVEAMHWHTILPIAFTAYISPSRRFL